MSRLGRGLAAGLLVIALCALLASATTRITSEAPTTLVIIDDNSLKTTHSTFFSSIKELGHKIEFINILEEPLVLTLHGKFLADNIVLFAPSLQDLGEYTKLDDLVAFVDNGGSILVASSGTLSEPLRALANKFGVDYDESTSAIVDTANDVTAKPALAKIAQTAADAKAGKAQTFVSVEVACGASVSDNSRIAGPCSPAGTPEASRRRVVFSGLSQVVAPKSKFVKSVLRGNPTTVTVDGGSIVTSGENTVLVSAMQSLVSSRAIFAGSLSMFSNDAYAFAGADNKAFATSLMHWAFHAKGMLRTTGRAHFKQEDSSVVNPSSYRIKDDVHYEISIEEYDGIARKWVPYESDRVQFEVIMLDPYIRQRLPAVAPGKYALDFKVPDTFGIYKFRTTVDQFQTGGDGSGFVEDDVIVSIRPFKHTEYERFLLVASPYYAGAFTVMAAFFLFSVLFLYSK